MKINLPSSQGGLNLRDSLDAMPPRDCIQMDNLIPDVGSDIVRPGYDEVSSQGAENIFDFNVVNNKQLLVATSDGIYKLDTSDGLRTELGTGYSNADWITSYFTDTGGTIRLFFGNGNNPIQSYDGTTLGAAGYTGASNLLYPFSFKNRMYFIERDTFNIWYGGTQAITGALTKFPVDNFFTKGGKLIAMARWTQDAGFGMDDLFVIFSTEGEVLVYSGTNPENADWSLRGRFNIPKPVGNDPLLNQGGDIIVLTQQGVFPLSEILSQDRANRVAISDKINPAFEGADFTANWSIDFYSKEGWYMVNKPSTSSFGYEQLVLNFKTGAWCRFVGMDALNWAILDDQIYFCNSKGVYEANKGTTDNGEEITYYKQQAYSQLNQVGVKQVLQVKPRYGYTGALEINRRIGVDFRIGDQGTSRTAPSGNQSLWDEAIWDVDFWTDEFKITSFKMTSFARTGDFISIGFFGQVNQAASFSSTELQVRVGNGYV